MTEKPKTEKPKGTLVSDMHIPSVDLASFQRGIQAYLSNDVIGHPSVYHQSPSKWPKGYLLFPINEPDYNYRTDKEVSVAHKIVQRLDFEGGKALWKRKHDRKREWVRFTYDNDTKQITVDNGRKVNLRGPVIEEYERYLARLVCT